jgi:hypothetical protein
MKYNLLIVTVLIAVCFSFCKNKMKNDAVKIVAEWRDKEVKFPEGIPCFSMGKDTTCEVLASEHPLGDCLYNEWYICCLQTPTGEICTPLHWAWF